MKSAASLLILMLFYLNAYAQVQTDTTQAPRQRRDSFKSRLFGGGDLGLQFGTFTLVNLAPVIGYKINDKLGMGIGPIYTYVKDKTYQQTYETSSYGGRLFGQYRFTENFFAYSEYQQVNTEVIDDFTYRYVRRNIPFLFAGGGYLAPIGDRSALMMMVLFDVIEDPYSYYQNPSFRIGFNTGF